MSMNRLIALGGAVLLTLGLVLGFTPVTSGVADCGRVLFPSGNADLLSTISAPGDPYGVRGLACPSERTDRATLVYVAGGIGLVLLAYVAIGTRARREQVTPERSPRASRP